MAWRQAIRQFKPLAVGMTNHEKAEELKRRVGGKIPVHAGERGLIELATMPEADIVLVAIVGTAGLEPALAAIRAGKDLAVASKEILVMAGELVMSEARKHGVKVLPVDSEHSAIFQCLEGRDPQDVKRLILTASGGPFRQTPKEEFADITVAQALKHPSWNMGQKITIDSATLFNKGLEMIEARWLFDIEVDRVDVMIHPQSVVHSMVEFLDGSILAQLSVPDMRYPIQYALTWPRRSAELDAADGPCQDRVADLRKPRPREVSVTAAGAGGGSCWAERCRPCSTRPTRWPWRRFVGKNRLSADF
jgi:1-deoxy-D-xylulose-5-phosphate reductoisomerase